MTRIPMSRQMYVDGIMQECQKDATRGRCSSVCCPPSSDETAIRNVQPMRRMTRVPKATIRLRTMRCRRVQRRGPDSGSADAMISRGVASATKPIVTALAQRSEVWGQLAEHGHFRELQLAPSPCSLAPDLVLQVRIDPALDLQTAVVTCVETHANRLRLIPAHSSTHKDPGQSHQRKGDLHIDPGREVFTGLDRHAARADFDAARTHATSIADNGDFGH